MRARHQQHTVEQALSALVDNPCSLNNAQRKNLIKLRELLSVLRGYLTDRPELGAGLILRWLTEALGLSNDDDEEEQSHERRWSIAVFADFAADTKLKPAPFLEHIEALEPSWGAPEEQQITITTVFRAKALEYECVIIPECDEGYMPTRFRSAPQVFDTAGVVQEPAPSDHIESERRLFYVALTRAKREVLIGCAGPSSSAVDVPTTNLPSRFIDEMLSATGSVDPGAVEGGDGFALQPGVASPVG